MKLVACLVLQGALTRALAWQTPGTRVAAPRALGGTRRWAEAAAAATAAEMELWPKPAIGDIVTFAGKWKGEAAVGRVAMLQVPTPA